jgi:hypothetical protein
MRRRISALLQRQPRRLADGGKTSIDVARDVRVQHPPAALGQHAEVAPRLRRLDHAEARLAARNVEIGSWLRRNLEKHAGVRPPL